MYGTIILVGLWILLLTIFSMKIIKPTSSIVSTYSRLRMKILYNFIPIFSILTFVTIIYIIF